MMARSSSLGPTPGPPWGVCIQYAGAIGVAVSSISSGPRPKMLRNTYSFATSYPHHLCSHGTGCQFCGRDAEELQLL